MKHIKQSPQTALTTDYLAIFGVSKNLINKLKCAGYHDNRPLYNKLFQENNIPFSLARKAFQQGYAMKQAQTPCNCADCCAK